MCIFKVYKENDKSSKYVIRLNQFKYYPGSNNPICQFLYKMGVVGNYQFLFLDFLGLRIQLGNPVRMYRWKSLI